MFYFLDTPILWIAKNRAWLASGTLFLLLRDCPPWGEWSCLFGTLSHRWLISSERISWSAPSVSGSSAHRHGGGWTPRGDLSWPSWNQLSLFPWTPGFLPRFRQSSCPHPHHSTFFLYSLTSFFDIRLSRQPTHLSRSWSPPFIASHRPLADSFKSHGQYVQTCAINLIQCRNFPPGSSAWKCSSKLIPP